MAWYNASWGYRVKVTVLAAKVDADLTAYPVYVDLNDLPAGFHTHCNQTDARDIRVTLADGTTEVPREVVFYDAATDTGELHFKADVGSDTDTDFYIYYDNGAATEPDVTNAYGRNAVWSDYKAVYHMNEDPTGTVIDSTGSRPFNANVGLDSADLTTGKIGKGINKDTTESWRNATGIAFSANSDVSFQCWLYPTNYPATNPGLWRDGDTSTGTNAFNIFNGSSGRPWVRWAATDILKPTSGYQVATNAWTMVHYVVTSASKVKFYAAGSEQYTADHAKATPAFTVYNLGWQYSTAEGVLGVYDEVRFRASNLTATWISTEYNNQSSPSTFYEVGLEETASTNIGKTGPIPLYFSDGFSW